MKLLRIIGNLGWLTFLGIAAGSMAANSCRQARGPEPSKLDVLVEQSMPNAGFSNVFIMVIAENGTHTMGAVIVSNKVIWIGEVSRAEIPGRPIKKLTL